MRSTGNNIKLTINDLLVNYDDNGPADAQAIIFIHGFPLNKSMWDLQVMALCDDYRVITYDVRGHGNSQGSKTAPSLALFAYDLVSLMDGLKLYKVILCGLSMGGYIALKAIENHPERFDALVLSDTQCAADTPEGKEKRWKAIARIQENGVEKYADESIKNFFSTESFTTRTAEIAAVREMILNTSEESLINTLLALSRREETCIKLPEIKVPVLIMVGCEDKITPLRAAQEMHEKIPDSFLKVIAQAGHLANLENPSAFNLQLRKFLHRFAGSFTAVTAD